MAHSSIFNHIKLGRLSKALGIPKTQALGCLEFLWHYVGDHQCNGDISNLTDEEIEEAAGWQGEPSKFVQACIKERWIDRDDAGTRIHDWDDWCPDYVKKRLLRRMGLLKNKRAADDGAKRRTVSAARQTSVASVRRTADNGASRQPHPTTSHPTTLPPNGAGGELLREALINIFYATGVAKHARGDLEVAAEQLNDLGATPDEVHRRFANWPTCWGIPCTIDGLVKKWNTVAAPCQRAEKLATPPPQRKIPEKRKCLHCEHERYDAELEPCYVAGCGGALYCGDGCIDTHV